MAKNDVAIKERYITEYMLNGITAVTVSTKEPQ